MQLEGKTAIITGGGRGIGRAIAIGFAGEGADVCVVSRTQSQLDEVAEVVESCGRKAVALKCDVSDRGDVERTVQRAVDQLGKVDILVNSAGGGLERTNIGEDNPDAWAEVIQINLMGTYYFCRAVLPAMREQGGGKIINVGSGMGHQARSGNSSYNSAKAAVWMFSRCLAMEVWPDNICVNELIPGPVYTELTSDIFERDKPHPSINGEWVKSPEEVVPLAVMLASQSEHGPTGQSLSLARRPI